MEEKKTSLNGNLREMSGVRVYTFAKNHYFPPLRKYLANELGLVNIHDGDMLWMVLREALEKRDPELAAKIRAEIGI